MCGNDGQLSELLKTAAERSGSFFASLSALHERGSESFAHQIYDDFAAKYRNAFGQRPDEKASATSSGDVTSTVATSEHDTTTASENAQEEQPPPAPEQRPDETHEDQPLLHEVKQSGIEVRDILPKWLKDRSINATLRSDILLIFFAQNQAGVISSDIFDELDRLKLKEPVGTVRSRISELRKFDLVEQRSDSGSGVFRVTEKGREAAQKAIRKYGFKITL